MKFRRKIQEIITGVLLISVLAGQISEIKVFAAENEGSLSDNSAEESVSADSFDSENIADTYEESVSDDESVEIEDADNESTSESENNAVSENGAVSEGNIGSEVETVSVNDIDSEKESEGDRSYNEDVALFSLPYLCETGDYRITIRKTNGWYGGYQGEIVLENISDKVVGDWSVSFITDDNIVSAWNTAYEKVDDHICFTSQSYNSVLDPGDSVTIGFQASGESETVKDVNVELIYNKDDEIGSTGGDISTEPYIYEYDGYMVSFKVTSRWSESCNVSVTVTNKSDEKINNWNLIFVSNDEILNPYNATIIGEGSGDGKWVFKNAGYNQDIPAGGSIEFGFQVHFGKRLEIPKNFYIGAGEFDVRSSDYAVINTITSSWDEGYTGYLCISNLRDTDIEDWVLTVQTDDEFINVWGASIKKVGENLYEVECPDYGQNIPAHGEINVGYQMNDVTKDNDNRIIVMGLKERSSSKTSVSANKIELDIPDGMFDGTSRYEATGGWKDIGEAYFKDLTREEQVAFSPEGFEYFKNELLIYASEGYDFDEIEAFAAAHQMVIVGYLEGTASYQLESVVDLDWEAISSLKNEFETAREVESVAYNYISELEPEFEISDEEWADEVWDSSLPLGDNWSMEAIDWEGALVDCGIAKDHSVSSNEYNLDMLTPVKIGVIDGRFDEWHEDLDDNIVVTMNNCDELSELIDNNDPDNHGTHVAGIIGAEFDNGVGISGVCLKPELYLCSYKGETERNCDKRVVSSVTRSHVFRLNYFLGTLIENDVKVINYSWGYKSDAIILSISDSNYSKVLRKMVFGNEDSDNKLSEKSGEVEKFLGKELKRGYDFLIVTSAGNENSEGYVPWTNGKKGGVVEISDYESFKNTLLPDGTDPQSQIKYDNAYSFGGRYSNSVGEKEDVLTGYNNEFTYIADEEIKKHIMVVGAVGIPEKDNVFYNSEFSNVGGRVDVVAPGVEVLSCAVTGHGSVNNNYITMQGTSMASPIVAGMAGFMLSVDPQLPCCEVKKRIIEAAKETSFDREYYNVDVYRYPVANLGNIYENSMYFNVKNDNGAALKGTKIEIYSKESLKNNEINGDVLYSGITDDKGTCCIKADGTEYIAVVSLEEYTTQMVYILPNQISYDVVMQPVPVTEHYDFIVVFDYSTSEEDLKKQKEIALEIINNMKEGDRITFAYTITRGTVVKRFSNPIRYYWTSDYYEALEMMDINFEISPFSIFNSNYYTVENSYTGGFYWEFEALNSITAEFSTNKRKVYIFYPGSRYDSTISDSYSNISTLIDQMSERSVEINMISVSYESNSIMNKLDNM